jgi:hypothetical protein
VVRERQRRFRPLIAVVGALLEPDLARRDHGDLRQRENAVGEDEDEDDQELGGDAIVYRSAPNLKRPLERSAWAVAPRARASIGDW